MYALICIVYVVHNMGTLYDSICVVQSIRTIKAHVVNRTHDQSRLQLQELETALTLHTQLVIITIDNKPMLTHAITTPDK